MAELQIVKQSAAVATVHKPKLGMIESSFFRLLKTSDNADSSQLIVHNGLRVCLWIET
ncbi:hypothetical protein [Algihabitans sp.]|uniref:hypothetical protein n=1 Tax=Algihabitans sp. TaxID=2821514 RepID=UPI003BAC58DE